MSRYAKLMASLWANLASLLILAGVALAVQFTSFHIPKPYLVVAIILTGIHMAANYVLATGGWASDDK